MSEPPTSRSRPAATCTPKSDTDRHPDLRERTEESSPAASVAPLDGQQHRPSPFTTDPDSLQDAKDDEDDRRPHADLSVAWHQAHREGRQPHETEGGDERALPADPVAVVAEDGSTHG